MGRARMAKKGTWPGGGGMGDIRARQPPKCRPSIYGTAALTSNGVASSSEWT